MFGKSLPAELTKGDQTTKLTKFFKEKHWDYTWDFDSSGYWYEILYNDKIIMQIEFEVELDDMIKTIKENVHEFDKDKASLDCIHKFANGRNFYIWPTGQEPKFKGKIFMIKFYRSRDPFGSFSNFETKHPVDIDGKRWPTTEHYFQSQKFAGTEYEELVRLCHTAKEAADMGRRRDLPLRKDWEQIKDDIMRKAVNKKVEMYQDIKDLLILTGNEEIIENSPTDYYWGCGKDSNGKNMLGKIYMEIRETLLKKP
jgi:hypothetical protein